MKFPRSSLATILVSGALWLAPTISMSQTHTPPTGSQQSVQQPGITLVQMKSDTHVSPWRRLVSLVGVAVMLALAWLISFDRKRIPWRVIGWGVALQFLFGTFVLKTPIGERCFSVLNDMVRSLLNFTNIGARFLFGSFYDKEPMFALRVLPAIIFFSSLMAVLYHLKILQKVVLAMAWAMQRTMRTSGAETLSMAANIFLGQTEAPLLVKPYVNTMTRSELMAVMIGGFATVAGGVMAAYVQMLQHMFPDIAGHLIAASVMAAPGGFAIAKTILPENEIPETFDSAESSEPVSDVNVIDAAARGAAEGLQLALGVGAMLLAFVALVALLNALLGLPALGYNYWVGHHALEPWTIQQILRQLFWPIALAMGVAPADCGAVATLLGEKMVLNEFVAYAHLGDMIRAGEWTEARSPIIIAYALCGFANFGSIAIQIGGIGGMAPNRRHDIARLGLRAMLGGTLTSCMTACIAGVLL